MKETLTPAQATAQGYISIGEAKKQGLTNLNRSSLNRQAENNTIPSCLVGKGSRACVWVLKEALGKNLPSKTENAYDKLEALWILKMRNGTLGKKPFSETTIANYEWAINKYWTLLGQPKSVQAITVQNFEYVLGKFEHNIEEKRDGYASKLKIYEALMSFMKLLIREGLKSKEERAAMVEYRPMARYQPKKKVVEDYEIVEAIKANQGWRKGRCTYDVEVMNILLHLYGYAGLRRSEAIDMRREHIFFKDKVLKVFRKNMKEAFVTPHPNIWPVLEEWVQKYCSDSPTGLLLLNKDGKKYTKRSISDKFQSFSEKFKTKFPDEVKPHALRRGFAVMMANLGMPLNQIQLILGHEDIETTMGYVLTNYKHAQKWVSENLNQVAVGETQETIVDPDDELLEEYLKG